MAREFITTAEAAEYLGISEQYLRHARHIAKLNGTSPEIPFYRLGRRTIRYRFTDIEAFLAKRRCN